jgi:TetR/AcrR family transcriptional regulator
MGTRKALSSVPAKAGRPAAKPRAKVAAKPAAKAPPRVRDAAATRESLVRAAVQEFSRLGFAGARIDEVAAVAGANKQLVYHYFGNKEGLYLVALESVYAEIREKEQSLRLMELPPLEAMARLIGFSFDYLAEHPEFIALLVDENRQAGTHVRQSRELKGMHSPFIEMLDTTLQAGIGQGVFRKDVDAVNLYISVAGVSWFFFSNNHTLSVIFDRKLDSRASLAQRRRHVIEFCLNALRP